MIEQDYRVALSFLRVAPEQFTFHVYRRLRVNESEARPDEKVFGYTLPDGRQGDPRSYFWVSFTARDGYERTTVQPGDNNHLTVQFLYAALSSSCVDRLKPEEYFLAARDFYREVSFVLERHSEGVECAVLEPYLLKTLPAFGFLVDFHFKRNPDVPFSRQVQRLSLSLDENYRSNKNFYSDRMLRMRHFIGGTLKKLTPIRHPELDVELAVSGDFPELKAELLPTRVYVFKNGIEKKSQFLGLKEAGPFAQPDHAPTFVFLFREQDRELARRLLAALRGKEFPYQFPGLTAMFGLGFGNDRIEHLVLADFTKPAIAPVIEKIGKMASPMPIIVAPGDDEAYYVQKALFTSAGIPTQSVKADTIRDTQKLRWAIGNIALQIFCKSGGKPWFVKPNQSNCLIVGISQVHLKQGDGPNAPISKYFAYSVMTDSSGLFQRLSILGRGTQEESYLSQVSSNLADVIRANCTSYRYVVIHTSFRLRASEMRAIMQAVKTLESDSSIGIQMAVLKVNTENRFFGYCNKHASLVPYESSVVQISNQEYLIWFEGTQYHTPNISRAMSGPTHIRRIFATEGLTNHDSAFLNDLMNLSGANWRGFNAKSVPVSIFYCSLVGRFIAEFDARDLPQSTIENIRPWFI